MVEVVASAAEYMIVDDWIAGCFSMYANLLVFF